MLQFKNLVNFFLSPKGRIKRLPFLFGETPTIGIAWLILMNEDIMNTFDAYLIFLFLGFVLIIAWIHWALIIKRLHDVNLSGWFSAIYLIPIINFLFLLFLLFKGSVEPNKYGERVSEEKQKS